jgi:hypothetical protein
MTHTKHSSRHGQNTIRSVDIHTRVATNNFPVHRPTVDRLCGDAFRFLLRLLLAEFQSRGFLMRIEGKPPATATDSNKFHRLWFKRFSEANPNFPNQGAGDLRTSLLQWFLKVFSTDPHGRVMDPGAEHRKRCNLGWPGFWLTDTEANDIADTLTFSFLEEWVDCQRMGTR